MSHLTDAQIFGFIVMGLAALIMFGDTLIDHFKNKKP